MSRDMTPKELHMMQKTLDIKDNLVDTMYKINSDGSHTDVWSDEEKAVHHKYPTVSMFGAALIDACNRNGLFSTEDGQQLFGQIEDYFNGKDIEDKELLDNTVAWYNGEFCPGYYMGGNTKAFAEYLKHKMKKNDD